MGSISKITRNTRLGFRQKLKNHEKLKSSVSAINKRYSSLIGPLHSLPDYLIIGAAKCGTSSLYEYLVQHPNVEPAIGKEINFFDMRYDRGINWYRTYFPPLIQRNFTKNIFKNNLITGEATPRYIDHPHAPERVAKTIPNVKLIVMLRNPVDRAYSHYQMEYANKNEDLSFEDILTEEPKRMEGEIEKLTTDKNYDSKEYPHRAYLATGHYAKYLKNWFKYFPREQFLIINNEDFLSDISKGYNKVLNFLGLPNFDLPEYKRIHGRKYDKMKSETRKKLIEYYRPHNAELYKLLNKDFGWDK